MLKLEKLEISGFKSFPDRTTLLFGEGVTGVVGPNGCGKSNIAEAISWVLGEQSAKNLRGGKMEDVIFNGTRDRNPMGMAEVLLTLIAVADITVNDTNEASVDDETRYLDAIQNAERASEAARTLVDEHNASEEASAKIDEEGSANPIEVDQAVESAAPDAAGSESELSTSNAAVSEEASLNTGVADQTPVENRSAEVRETGGNAELTVEASQEASVDSVGSEPESESTATTAPRRPSRPASRKRVAVSAGERVTVGRRLYRTGDSDYLMNGRQCLLRDVQDLFAGTGLGGAHYAIVEQGRIGQILSSKPLDRRGLIEEAAGITKFKSRKRAAELKLESAKGNLTRLNDIISEVERQVNSLKRQAQKARRYRRLRDEMRSLQKVAFTEEYYRLTGAAERIAAEFEAADVFQKEIDSQVRERESEHRISSSAARACEDALSQLRERASAIDVETERARSRAALEEKQLSDLTARLEELEREQEAFAERLSLADEEVLTRTTALRALEAQLIGERAELIGHEADFQRRLSELRDTETAIEQIRQQLLVEIGNTERLRNLAISAEEEMARLDRRRETLLGDMRAAISRRADGITALTDLEDELQRVVLNVSSLRVRLNEKAFSLDEVRSTAKGVNANLAQVQSERREIEHRLASLEDLDRHRAYYTDAVQQILSPEQAARFNAMGTLADYVEVEPQYERLIESLFSRELQSVIVPTIDDALAGVEYLKAEGLGRGAFLVVGLHGGEDSDDRETDQNIDDLFLNNDSGEEPSDSFLSEPFAAGLNSQPWPPERDNRAPRFELEVLRAIDLIKIRPEFRAAVEKAFPDKCAASVAPDLEAALQLSIETGWRIYVTHQGEQVVNGRLIVSGAGEQGTSLLALKREIRRLREEAVPKKAEEEQLNEQTQMLREQSESLGAAVAAIDAELRSAEREAASLESTATGLGRELARSHQQVCSLENEQIQIATEISENAARRVDLDRRHADAVSSRDQMQAALNEAQEAYSEMRAGFERFAEELSTFRVTVAARGERLQAQQSELKRIESEAEDLRSRLNRNRVEHYEDQGRIEQLTASLAACKGTLEELETARSGLAVEITSAAEELAAARGRTDELEFLLAELRQAASSAHERRGQIEVDRARVQSEAQHLARTCQSELAMPLEDVVTSVELERSAIEIEQPGAENQVQAQAEGDTVHVDQTDDPNESIRETPCPPAPAPRSSTIDLEAVNSRLDELRAKLDDLGPVNMMALEELEEADQRYKFLSTQRRDILDSILQTEEALSEIRRRSQERFRHAFISINENFQRTFIELFGGGRGEMILIDEEEVLESGIDLIAQPPGKRLQNVLLLSGGEKAMTAIALVIAIFQYRPSPFCVLDEVDAPLDEMNVGRFSEKVREMSSETQFLVITHNKRTMEAARALYGVTMEQPGVSKLVSVRFE